MSNQPMVKSIAVLGTGSDVGKSVISAGICRILSNNSVTVAPFKAQNMSNNAEPALLSSHHNNTNVSPSSTHSKDEYYRTDANNSRQLWGEIGSAQSLQAQACRIVPRVEMNPILLKSGGRRESDGAFLCNVIVMVSSFAIEDYGSLGQRTESLKTLVLEAHKQLAEVTGAQVIVIEGAGSCTELNLMERDIVNLPLVRALNCPWLLVANIDPGGVFAQIVGTKACVSKEDWDLCAGVIVNRLRGDVKYFEPGPKMLEDMIGKPIFVVPYLSDLNLPEEDGLGVERRLANEHEPIVVDDTTLKRVVVIAYPHIAITSDLIPLENDDYFKVYWRRHCIPAQTYPEISAIILPGSRLTRSDLEWLKQTEWVSYIETFVKLGGNVLGICGGYQMLGREVLDPVGVEGESGTSMGLGYLPITTIIEPAECKVVRPRRGRLFRTNLPVNGFELHCGRTSNSDDGPCSLPLVTFLDSDECQQLSTKDGTQVGNVRGTYIHGILETKRARVALLTNDSADDRNDEEKQDHIDKFAHHLEQCGLDYKRIMKMVW
jgi:Cobyric acid synthase